MKTNAGFLIHTVTTAPEGSRDVAGALQQAFGGALPNLFGVLAGSPELLKAAAALNKLVGETSLSPVEQQVIAMATSHEKGCEYCLAAHTFLARRLPAEPVHAARDGRPVADPKLEALRRFTAALVSQNGRVSPELRAEVARVGYTERQILEVILVITMKTAHNLVNNYAETPIDAMFQTA